MVFWELNRWRFNLSDLDNFESLGINEEFGGVNISGSLQIFLSLPLNLLGQEASFVTFLTGDLFFSIWNTGSEWFEICVSISKLARVILQRKIENEFKDLSETKKNTCPAVVGGLEAHLIQIVADLLYIRGCSLLSS